MADHSAFSSTPDARVGASRSPGNVGLRPPLPTIGSTVAPVGQRTGDLPSPIPSVTTYYYRASGGSRGSVTSVGSIPGGAVLLYQVTQ